jgi:hypothetical protein
MIAFPSQVVHYRSLPAELAELLTVQVLDTLPLCLSSDPNVHLEENTDFVGLSPLPFDCMHLEDELSMTQSVVQLDVSSCGAMSWR